MKPFQNIVRAIKLINFLYKIGISTPQVTMFALVPNNV